MFAAVCEFLFSPLFHCLSLSVFISMSVSVLLSLTHSQSVRACAVLCTRILVSWGQKLSHIVKNPKRTQRAVLQIGHVPSKEGSGGVENEKKKKTGKNRTIDIHFHFVLHFILNCTRLRRCKWANVLYGARRGLSPPYRSDCLAFSRRRFAYDICILFAWSATNLIDASLMIQAFFGSSFCLLFCLKIYLLKIT